LYSFSISVCQMKTTKLFYCHKTQQWKIQYTLIKYAHIIGMWIICAFLFYFKLLILDEFIEGLQNHASSFVPLPVHYVFLRACFMAFLFWDLFLEDMTNAADISVPFLPPSWLYAVLTWLVHVENEIIFNYV
jgi:hypothetical protein